MIPIELLEDKSDNFPGFQVLKAGLKVNFFRLCVFQNSNSALLPLSTIINFVSNDTLILEVQWLSTATQHPSYTIDDSLTSRCCFFIFFYLIMFTMLGSLAVGEQPEDSTLGFALSEMSKKKKQQKNCWTVKGLEMD